MKKTLRSFITENKEAIEDNLVEALSFRMDPPNIIVLKRSAIRIFPDGRKVALYHAEKINKYISIPYSDVGNKEILQVEEKQEDVSDKRGNMPTLQNIAQSGESQEILFDDNTTMKVDPMTAKAILNVYGAVNMANRTRIEHMVNVDQHSFEKVAAFAHGAHIGN